MIEEIPMKKHPLVEAPVRDARYQSQAGTVGLERAP
jgi:hypothetical protein